MFSIVDNKQTTHEPGDGRTHDDNIELGRSFLTFSILLTIYIISKCIRDSIFNVFGILYELALINTLSSSIINDDS